MKIAAIDVGSNSIHMIIVDSRDGLEFEIVDREKEMVRLGSGSFKSRELSEAAMDRAEKCLRKYKQLAERLHVDRLIAQATSAVREARNGGDFITRVHERVGIHLEVITSSEEARLIALAVQHSVDFRGRRGLLFDIGGGSVELSVCDSEKIHLSESLKLGVIRLTDQFVRRDPIGKKARRAIEKFAQKSLTGFTADAARMRYRFAVGTSGTILTLADVAHQIRTGESLRHYHQQILELKSLELANRQLQMMTLKERARFEGVNLARAGTLVAGGILLETLMKQFGLKRLTLSTRALREGMILHFLRKSQERLRSLEVVPDLRRRSVLELARRSQYDRNHSEWIAQTVLKIFDATHSLHRLGPQAREMLEHAARLHDIGIQISYTRHHRHSQYIIQNSGMRGFTPQEIQLLGLVARFHRKSEPTLKDPECALMRRKEFETLRWLSAILRIADGFDRSHNQIVDLVSVKRSRGRWHFEMLANDDAELELWGAQRKSQLFEKLVGVPVEFHVSRKRGRKLSFLRRCGGVFSRQSPPNQE